MLGVLAWLAGGSWVGRGDGGACFHAKMYTSEPGRCTQSPKAWWETGMRAQQNCEVPCGSESCAAGNEVWAHISC